MDNLTLYEAAELAAKQNGHTGTPMVDVFEWNGSTYVFADQNGDHKVNLADGFIKLEGVEHVGPHEFGLPLSGQVVDLYPHDYFLFS